MTKNYDQEFGPNGIYGWPACLDIAERLLEAAPYAESSADCLNDDFFSEYLDYLDKHLFEDYPEEEAYELAEAARKSRQELFKDATKWPLPYLVASAIYKILSTEAERIHIIDDLWRDLFWPFLSFDEPLFDMLQAKGWGKIYRKEIREGFKLQLRFEIRGLIGNRLMWGSDKDKPWLTREGFASHIYPEDLLRSLDLVGIDPGRAHSAVDKVFKLHSLTPLYRVLSYKPSSTCATVVRHKHRDEEGRGEEGKGEKGETKSPKKPLAGLRIDVLKFIFGALIVARGVIASNRLRLSRSNWASTRPVPCFATSSMGWGCLPIPKTRKQSAPRESSSSRSQQQPPEAITSASQESRPKRTGLFKERLSFQGTGLFKGKLSLQRNRAFITQQRWTPWEELQELQRKQSLRSHQLIDQSSVGSSDEPAEQLQPLRTEASVVQRVWRTLSDKLSDKYNIVSGRKKGWINNGRILTEGSPEIKAWRDLLVENGETLPSITQVCVHLQRRTTMLGTEVTFTKQGTLTERWAVDKVTRLLEKYLVIDSVSVKEKAGLRHECDQVTLKNSANMSDLRHDKIADDRSPVVIMTKERHRVRTTHNRQNQSLFDLNNLTAQLSDLFKQTRRADQNFWMSEEKKEGVLDDDLTPAFLAKQYSLGHLCDQVRMQSNLKSRNFHPNQATAFLINRRLIEVSESAVAKFVSSRISLPLLDAESAKVFSQFTDEDKENAYQNYAQKIRRYNLSDFTIETAKCVKLAHSLELYSDSLAGKADGCTAFQTEQHKERKTKIMRRYREALDEAKIPKAEANMAVKNMLQSANIKKDGTLRAGRLSRQLDGGQLTNAQVREVLRQRICSIGLSLTINTLYEKGGTFKMQMPAAEVQKTYYKQSVEEVASGVNVTSTWTQHDSSQWSDAGSSDQGSP